MSGSSTSGNITVERHDVKIGDVSTSKDRVEFEWYVAICSCNWQGIIRRTRSDAVRSGTLHVQGAMRYQKHAIGSVDGQEIERESVH